MRAQMLSLIKDFGVPAGAGVAGVLVVLYVLLFALAPSSTSIRGCNKDNS